MCNGKIIYSDIKDNNEKFDVMGITDEGYLIVGEHSINDLYELNVMEALSFGTPILSFPDEGHSEQENNAAVIEEEGYGRMLSYSTPPEVILECIREVLEDKKYRDKVKRLQRLASELDGPKAVRELLEKEAGKKVS